MSRPIEWQGEKKEKAIRLILLELSNGKSLRQILDNDNTLPARKTFYEWLSNDNELSNHYARSCETRADIIFDEMVEIADDGTNDYMTKQIGDGLEVQVLNSEHIQRSRLRIDTRKWILSKMNPKKYGDKTDITSNGESINIPIIEWVKTNENNED